MIIKRITSAKPSTGSNKKLILFFAGWGMDENLFKTYHIPGYDFMIVYDYQSFSFDEAALKPYSEIAIVAWSMGVWAASQLLQDKNYTITVRIAVNGTHFPVDDQKGIPREIFNGTLKEMNEHTLYKFRRRMCGQGDVLKRFLENAPQRNIESLKKELESIGKETLDLPPSSFKWDRIYIGNRDRIFPAENQMRAWEGENYIIMDEAHYPEKWWSEIFRDGLNISREQ